MPFLGSQPNHHTCSSYIQRYLEKNNRALAHDFANIRGREAQAHWARTMDNTRELAGNDTPYNGKKAVTFRHFVLSPDPRDGVDLETLRAITTDWVRHFFGADGESGVLGCYEVVIVYHDDNKRRTVKGEVGIPHAHIIVNNTNLAYGEPGPGGRYNRLQINKQVGEIDMPNFAQELAELRGCTYFDNPSTLAEKREREREERALAKAHAKLLKEQREVKLSENGGRYTTKEEKAIIRAGHFSWKQDLCEQIQIARRLSTDEASFLEELKALEIGVREKDGDWVFSHPSNPQHWQATGYRLGKNYTRQAINNDILTDREKGCPRSPEVRDNVTADLMQSYQIEFNLVAIADRSLDVHQVAETLRVIDAYGVRCQADFERIATVLELQVKEADTPEQREALSSKLTELRVAQERSKRGDFFLGVADTKKMPTPPSRKTSHPSGKSGGGGAASRGRKQSRGSERSQGRSSGSQKPQRPNTPPSKGGGRR